jgi:hypothetical protein
MKEVTEGEDFKTLSSELDAAVLDARKALKPFLVRGMELERSHLRTAVIKAVATSLPLIAELLLAYVDGEAYGKHTLVNDFLTMHRDEVLSYLGSTVQEFTDIYLEGNQLDTLPATAAFTTTQQASTRADGEYNDVSMLDEASLLQIEEEIEGSPQRIRPNLRQPSQEAQEETRAPPGHVTPLRADCPTFRPIINGYETCLQALRTFVSSLANAKEAYHKTIDENAKQARIAKVIGSQNKSQHYDNVAEINESEETATPATLASLTYQKIEGKTKPIRQDVASVKSDNLKLSNKIARLEKELQKLKTPSKESRGAGSGAASQKKSTQQSKEPSTSPSSTPRHGRGRGGAAKGNASQEKSSNCGSRRLKSKSPSNREKKRRSKSKRKSKSKEN